MKQGRAHRYFYFVTVIFLTIFWTAWLTIDDTTKVFAQEKVQEQKMEIGRYQFEYVPSVDGGAPSYIVFDTATGDFWQAKGFIENLDDFVVYSRSNLPEGLIGGHTVKLHKHK